MSKVDWKPVAGFGAQGGVAWANHEQLIGEGGVEVSAGGGLGFAPRLADQVKLKEITAFTPIDPAHYFNLVAAGGVKADGNEYGFAITPHVKVLGGNTVINGGPVMGYRANLPVGNVGVQADLNNQVVYGGEFHFFVFGGRVLFDPQGFSSASLGIDIGY
ncbi:MAG: hypothetical protein HY541_05865 [Deltaproteobacteria bacterium]|nr:hypothetical protein [Deltaproteobacteria bacterium]